MAAGTSSFGMSGVNAFMLVKPPLPFGLHSSSLGPWRRARAYIMVDPHHFLVHAMRDDTISGVISFAFQPRKQQVAYLWDAQVRGQALLPSVALLEMGTAAARVLNDESSTHVTLKRVALPRVADMHSMLLVTCTVNARAGALAVQSLHGTRGSTTTRTEAGLLTGTADKATPRLNSPTKSSDLPRSLLPLRCLPSSASVGTVGQKGKGEGGWLAIVAPPGGPLKTGYSCHPSVLCSSTQAAVLAESRDGTTAAGLLSSIEGFSASAKPAVFDPCHPTPTAACGTARESLQLQHVGQVGILRRVAYC